MGYGLHAGKISSECSALYRAFVIVMASAAFAAVPSSGHAAEEVSGTARIIDGDTLDVGGQRVRLFGVDAPERRQYCQMDGGEYPCGAMATAWLAERTQGKMVRCQGRDRDRYDRIVAVCTTDTGNLNEELVRSGWALAYRRYSSEYVRDEELAKNDGNGLWAGEFEPPWAWKRGARTVPIVTAGGPDCIVKGNVNMRGERIYHLPGSAVYGRLRINPKQGDRCFVDEDAARAAGFRPAGR